MTNANNTAQANQLVSAARAQAERGGAVVGAAVVAMAGSMPPRTEQTANLTQMIARYQIGEGSAGEAVARPALAAVTRIAERRTADRPSSRRNSLP